MKVAAGSGAVLAAGSAIYLNTRPTVRLAMIGAGVRANDLAHALTWMRRVWPISVDIRHVVDPDRTKASRLAACFAPSANLAQDYREALADDQVDAVIVATCSHWHAKITIDAMRSGKAVYCEKPMSITYDEALQVADVASATNQIFQLGTQQRHHALFRDLAELVLNDRLGEVELVEILLDRHEYDAGVKRCSGLTPPRELDWNLWLGPAQYREYCPHVVKDWKLTYQFGGGEVLNWGTHHWDIAHWILETRYGAAWLGSCRITPQAVYQQPSELFDVPRKYRVEFEFVNRPRVVIRSVERGQSTGLRMTGTRGRVFVNRARLSGKPAEDLRAAPLPGGKRSIDHSTASRYVRLATALHLNDFLRSVIDGSRPISNADTSFRANGLLQLATIACRVNQPLDWDQESRTFVNNKTATAMLKRPWREV